MVFSGQFMNTQFVDRIKIATIKYRILQYPAPILRSRPSMGGKNELRLNNSSHFAVL
jgi:hypothetical protein